MILCQPCVMKTPWEKLIFIVLFWLIYIPICVRILIWGVQLSNWQRKKIGIVKKQKSRARYMYHFSRKSKRQCRTAPTHGSHAAHFAWIYVSLQLSDDKMDTAVCELTSPRPSHFFSSLFNLPTHAPPQSLSPSTCQHNITQRTKTNNFPHIPDSP